MSVSSLEARVAVRGITKRFGGQLALNAVTLGVAGGTIHALVGENGAGKSTLGKILAGAHRPDEGAVLMEGEVVDLRGPTDALARGVTIVAQEITLIPEMTVLDNVFMGSEICRLGVVRRGKLEAAFNELCGSAGFVVPGDARVGELPVGEQQKVEILRALARRSEVLILDEPTAALSLAESRRFLDLMRRLRDQGATLVFISHFLEDVLAVADVVSVLKDGRHVLTTPTAGLAKNELVTAMLGRELDLNFPRRGPKPERLGTALSVRGLTREPLIRDVSLDVARGEIVGLAGLMGSGRSELVRAIFGADRPSAGSVHVDGREVDIRSPEDAVAAGLAMLPESRKEQGLVLNRPLRENLTLAHTKAIARWGVIDRRREADRARSVAARVRVTRVPLGAAVETLSGGNQQKVLLGKWLLQPPVCFLVDELTRGVDIGAKHALYEILLELRANGVGVLLVSSDFEELIGLADRVLVMRRGKLAGPLTGEEITEERIMSEVFDDAGPVAALT